MKTPRKTLALIVASLLALNACDWAPDDAAKKEQAASSVLVQPIEAKTESGTVSMLLPDFTKLVEQEGATVANIQANKTPVSRVTNNESDLNQLPDNDPSVS